METKAIQIYEEKGRQLLTMAKTIMIVDEVTREIASDFSVNARKMIRFIEKDHRDDISTAHQLHKNLLDRMKRLTAPFKEAQGIVDSEIRRDYLEQERVKQEAERRVQEKVEAEKREQEMRLAEDAEEFIKAGDMKRAEELLDSEVVVTPIVPVPKVQQTTKSAAGSTTVKRDIDVKLVDKSAVIEAVAAGKLPYVLVNVDVGAAKRYAKASGLMFMPGFSITETANVAGRVG